MSRSGMGDYLIWKISERILHFDSKKHEITWDAVAEKLPGFISDLQNAFTLDAIDENSTKVTSNLSVNLSGILGFIMSPGVSMYFKNNI